MKHRFLLFTLTLLTISFVSGQTIGIVGPAADGWPDPATNPNPDIMLTDNGDGTHSIQSLPLSTGDAKFRTGQDWALDDYGGTTFPTGNTLVNDPSANIPVTAGNYDITLDLNANTYTFTSVGPTTSAPTPTDDPADVVSLFSDTYTDVAVANYDPNWGQSGHTQVNTTFDPTGSGTDFVLAYPNFNYQGTEIGSNLDLSGMDFLNIDIWVPAGTNRMVKVSPINNGTGTTEVLVEVPVTPGSWNSVSLPKSDFTGMTWDSVFQLKFDGQFNSDGSANTASYDIYVDNIYFSQQPTASSSCNYTLRMFDSFGDGWNGNTMDLLVNGTVVLDDVAIFQGDPDESQKDILFSVSTGDQITTIWNGGGTFGGETSYEILDVTNTVVGSGAESSITTPIVANCPGCLPPTGLTVSNVTATSAQLDWTATTSAETGGYEYVLITDGSTPDDTTTPDGSVGTGVTTANLTSLSSATQYDVYVRAVCSASEISPWSVVASFETLCVTFVAPFSEDFNANPTSIPLCWSQGAANAEDWQFDDAANIPTSHIGNNGTLPSSSPSAGGFAWVDDSSPQSLDTRLESPMIDVSGLTIPALSFYFISDNEGDPAGNVDFRVEVWDGAAWNEVFFSNQNSANEDWEEVFVDLSTLTITGNIQLAFIVDENNGTAFDDDVAIDDVSVDEAPSCIKPTNLSTSNLTVDSADLSWDASSTETNGYDYVLITDGSTPDGTTTPTGSVGTGMTMASLTGLTSNTTYNAYVRTKCGGEDSEWSSATSFTTLCSTFTAPYSENFDSVTAPAIPSCWGTAGNFASEVETDDSHFGIDDAPSAPNFIKFGDLNLTDGDEAILVSPQFSDLGSFDKRIRFKAAFEDGDVNSHNLFVGVMSDPTDATTFVEIAVVTSSLDETFSEFTVDLDNSTLIGSSQYVAIAAGSAADFDELAIDDFIYETIPTCDIPSNFQAANLTNDSVDLSWNAPAVAPSNGYDWEIVPAGDGQGNNVVASGNSASTSVTATGLSGNTLYDAYVRSNCGGGDGESIYIGPVSFRTIPDAAQGLTCSSGGASSVVFSDDFDDTSAGWTGDINTGNDSWEIPDDAGSSNTGADNAFSGSNYMNFESSNTAVSQGSIVSPAIDLSNGNAEAELSFWMHAYGVDMGTLEVGVGTSASGPFTNEFTWSGQLQTSGADAWVNVGVNLDAYIGQTIYIQLTQIDDQGGFEGDMSIDLFEVSTCLSCGIPSNLSVSNITASSVDLNWDSVSSATDGYEWVIMNVGDMPDPMNAVATNTTASGVTTDTASGLTSATNYDAYVRSNCGSGLLSDWSAVLSFSTTPDFCGGDNFIDNGGLTGDYLVNSNETTVISPDNAGDVVSVTFLSFDTEENWDGLMIYDGPDTSQPIFDSGYVNTFGALSDGAWNGTGSFSANGITFTSTHPSGALTFVFTSDATVVREGWEASVTCGPPPSCPAPLGLSSSNITDNSADLSWDEETSAVDGYEYVLITDGSTPDGTTTPTGSVADATILSVSLTGLTPDTNYDAYVRSVCDAAAPDVSDWSSVESFTTLPVPPVNDDLCDAIALTVDATSAGDAFTNVGATAQTDEPAALCFNGGINGSVWFTFVAPPSGSVEVTTDIAGATLTDTEIAVYQEPSDCTDLTTLGAELGCDQDGGDPAGIDFNSVLNLTDLTPGDTYYVQVDQWGTATPGDFGIEVREKAASVQIIHNSADPAAQFVDIYLNGNLVFDDFEFRTATPFVPVPADVAIDIDVAPSTSVDVTESIFNLNTTLTDDESYIVVADGVLDTSQFDTSVNTIDFNLEVFVGAQQASTNPGETSVLVHHGSTDAPTVDVRETSVPAGIIVDDISYPDFQGYLDLVNQDYIIDVELGDNSAVVQSYQAPLQTLGLADAAITVVASGFLDPAANQNGAAFGLWVASSAGGPLVELPVALPEPMNPAPDPTEDPADVISMFSGVYTDVPVDTWLTVWSSALLEDIQIQGNDTKKYTDLDFAGIETVANPIDASGMDFFHIDVWSPNATTFRVKLVDLGSGSPIEGEIAFSIAQEQWVSLQIPLTDFADPAVVTDPNNLLTATNSIQQVIISGLPVGAVTAYVDNVYFSKTSISTTQFDSNNFSYYPNPAASVLNLQTTGQVESIKVYNMLGQQVLTETPNTVSPSLNVEALQSGTYIMNVTINGSSENFRFIKK